MRPTYEEVNGNGRKVSEILTEMKQELLDFINTRVSILRTEMQEKLKTAKAAAPLAIGGVVLLSTAYVLLTLALVCLISAAFTGSLYRWFFGFTIVGVLWGGLGAMAAYMAMRELRAKSLMPTKTIEVLKGDKVWLRAEVKNQI